jgi:PhoPQ-activated pathogenicity-related protein
VAVVVPNNLVYRNISNVYIASITARANTDPQVDTIFDPDLMICDGFAKNTQAICVTVYQVPSNPMIWNSDPD